MTSQAIIQEANRLLGADSSQPVWVDRQTFWTSLVSFANGSFDRRTILEKVDAVFLVSEQFVLYKFVLESADKIFENHPLGITRKELWKLLDGENLSPKHSSHRLRLLDDLEVIPIGKNRFVAISFVLTAIKEILHEAEYGLRIGQIKSKLTSKKILPNMKDLRKLLKVCARREGDLYFRAEQKNMRSMMDVPQNVLQAVREFFQGSPVRKLSSFLIFLSKEQLVNIPDVVDIGEKKATYHFLNDFGAVEVNNDAVTLWQHLFDEAKEILESVGTEGFTKQELWTILEDTGILPVYRSGKSKLSLQPFVVKVKGRYYLDEHAPQTDMSTDEDVDTEENADNTTEEEERLLKSREVLALLGALENGDLVLMSPDEIEGIYNDALRSIMMRLLTNPPDWFKKRGGTEDMLLRRLQYIVAEMMALIPDPENLLMEMHHLQGAQTDVIEVTGFGGTEVHKYPRTAAVIVVRRPHQVATEE